MKMWDCIAVSCPSCDAPAGQRCKPLGPPYKVRSKRLEVSVPHVLRIRKYNRRDQKGLCEHGLFDGVVSNDIELDPEDILPSIF